MLRDMARKSRKNTDATAPIIVTQPTFRVGAYVRLSAVDRKQKGDSIENQQAIIIAYIAEHDDLELTDTYIDNGTTGQNFDRPEFRRLLSDLESGKINAVASKDLSRLGRNAIDTGYYIEKYFPTRNIRYIAINDDYDSANPGSGGITVSLKNMVNEHYALEVGRKIHTTKQMNIKNGLFVGRIAPYGYLKSKEDSYRLVIDDYAAPLVHRMFEMAANGDGISAIQKWLGENGVLPPKRYLHSIGLAAEKEAQGSTYWSKSVLHTLLTNRVYCGDMVQGKGRTNQYNNKRLPPSEWIITANTHEPIVSRELFDKVGQLYASPRIPTEKKESGNIFKGKIFCGHCGYTMRRNVDKGRAEFRCVTRQVYSKDDCPVVAINEELLKTLLIGLLREQKADFADMLTPKTVTPGNSELRNVQTELFRNEGFLKGLYESLVSGDITNGEYTEMRSAYEVKISALKERERELRETARSQALETAKRAKAADTMNGVTEITKDAAGKLIERIRVFENKRIEVKFTFSDEVFTAGGQVQ
jgi:DNA invertase Pin-like site-specific DNA recombinase